MQSRKRTWESELSLIDTALLLAGVLTASSYFSDNSKSESEVRIFADALYRRVDWRWTQNGKATLSQGWKPERGFLHYGREGYSEAIILYILAVASPTYPVPSCYQAWTGTYQLQNLYGHDFLYAGPFTHPQKKKKRRSRLRTSIFHSDRHVPRCARGVELRVVETRRPQSPSRAVRRADTLLGDAEKAGV
jgi:hypothetical protein